MGRWVTLEDDQHIYINDKGEVLPRGPGTKPTHRYKGARSEAERGKTASLVAKTRAKRAGKPSLREQAAAARAAKGISPADRRAMAKGAKHARSGKLGAGTRVFFGSPGEKRLADIVAKGRRAAVMERVEDRSAKPLHEHAQEAANAVPASKRFGDKAFLVDVHHEYQKTGGKLGLAEFKQQLADNPEARVKLGMSRNDLNAREDHAKTQASEAQVKSGGRVLAEYHFVTTTGKARRSK